ncbi:hypothetical protein ACW5EG_03070 [Luteimonas sp. A611]
MRVEAASPRAPAPRSSTCTAWPRSQRLRAAPPHPDHSKTGHDSMTILRMTDLDLAGKRVLIRQGERH